MVARDECRDLSPGPGEEGDGADAPPSSRDLVQAVADFVDDLVEDDEGGSGSGDDSGGDHNSGGRGGSGDAADSG